MAEFKQVLILLAEKSTVNGQFPLSETATVLVLPEHNAPLISVTVMSPLLLPKSTVMALLPCPETMVAPIGTVHVKVDPVEPVTEYVAPFKLRHVLVGPEIVEVAGVLPCALKLSKYYRWLV